MRGGFVVGVCLLAGVACADRAEGDAHALIVFDTDAPLPGGTVPALFDRLRIEIYDADADAPCAACTRDEVLTESGWRSGLSLTLQTRRGAVLRTRLFRAASASSDGPSPRSTVEVWSRIEPNETGEIIVFLPTDAVGVAVGSRAMPVPPARGARGDSRVGAWPPARTVPCVEAPRDGEVCVPGGAFVMGNVKGAESWEAIVSVGPFFLDVREMTVGDLNQRGVVLARAGCSPQDAPQGDGEALAATCVSWQEAREICLSMGSDLPTEAQWEFAAGLRESREFAWGAEPPRCEDAVWGRATMGGASSECNTFALERGQPTGGPVPFPVSVDEGALHAASRARSFATITGARIFDLAGNVEEWARDAFERRDAPCWSSAGPRMDPLCESTVADPLHVLRGGAFDDSPVQLASTWRKPGATTARTVGFRCARPARGGT